MDVAEDGEEHEPEQPEHLEQPEEPEEPEEQDKDDENENEDENNKIGITDSQNKEEEESGAFSDGEEVEEYNIDETEDQTGTYVSIPQLYPVSRFSVSLFCPQYVANA